MGQFLTPVFTEADRRVVGGAPIALWPRLTASGEHPVQAPKLKQARLIHLLSRLQGDDFHVADGVHSVAVADAHRRRTR